jgi:ubiquinone/menaquinone biosynthesis C-methylase UbiE
MKSKDLYPAIFSRHAAAYEQRLEQVMARGEARGRQRLIELIDPRPGMRILDLACGPGNLSARFASLVSPDGDVFGVDLAPGMIERARARRIANARFEVMDIEQLAVADASFDAAACGHGLQFVPDLARAMTEAHRVLRHGSKFAASLPAGSGQGQAVWQLLDSVLDRWLPPAPEAADRASTQAVILDPDALTAVAREAGFGEVRVEVIEESVRWESAEQLVALFTGWWDCAARLEGIDPERRTAFVDDALTTVRPQHPGPFETTARNHVLFAVVP